MDCGSRRSIAAGRLGIGPVARQKLASTLMLGGNCTIPGSMHPIVGLAADISPDTKADSHTVFLENRIDADILPSLTVEDLKDLGVTLVGDRRRLLDAIAALGAAVSTLRRAGGGPRRTGVCRARTPAADGDVLRSCRLDTTGSIQPRASLATRFDPEDLREVISAYHHVVAATIAGFDGFVAKYMGEVL